MFVGWTVLSTYIYVCKIKELCTQPQTTIVEGINQYEVLTSEPKVEDKIEEKVLLPKDLVVYFAFDKSNFTSSTEANVYFTKSSDYMLENGQTNLSITGHTDAVGTEKYNQALGLRRAQSLKIYFESKGVAVDRIKIESKGEKEPTDDNSTASGRANNRRTVVTIK